MLGGKALEVALSLLVNGGTCVTLGWSASPSGTATIDLMKLIQTGGTTLYALKLAENQSEHLAWLAQMVATQRLHTSIEVETSWLEIADVAKALSNGQFTGKAVLHLS